jgi:hypothetical protein
MVVAASVLAAGVAWGGDSLPERSSQAIPQVTDTAVPIQFPTQTATPQATPSPTRTGTPQGRSGAMAEAISPDTPSNVRSGPDIGAQLVGTISVGTQYPILGRRFEWYLIEYPDGPGGRAWVHQTVVNVIGDANSIQELETDQITTPVPTATEGVVGLDQTLIAVTQTPGAAETLVIESGIELTATSTVDPNAPTATRDPSVPLPTFTYPAMTVTPVIIPDAAPTVSTETTGVPPIVPILALGALGLMGLLVALLKRL